MGSRGLVFVVVLVAVGIGVWVGVATAGTAATPWIQAGLGIAMLLIGGFMLASGESFNRLFGAGFMLMGASQLTPDGRWRIAISFAGLGFMLASVVLRRRAANARRSAG